MSKSRHGRAKWLHQDETDSKGQSRHLNTNLASNATALTTMFPVQPIQNHLLVRCGHWLPLTTVYLYSVSQPHIPDWWLLSPYGGFIVRWFHFSHVSISSAHFLSQPPPHLHPLREVTEGRGSCVLFFKNFPCTKHSGWYTADFKKHLLEEWTPELKKKKKGNRTMDSVSLSTGLRPLENTSWSSWRSQQGVWDWSVPKMAGLPRLHELVR